MAGYRCEAERVYAVTLSAELSGSYNSAVLGKNLYHEEYGDKEIYVFNSRSASVGETLIALKIAECEEAGMDFEEVVRTVEGYIESQHTYFVLETLETLRKNGRLSDGLRFKYQACHGLHASGHDLPVRAGQRDQEGSGKNDRRGCAGREETGGKDTGYQPLQLSRAGAESERDAP